MYRGVGSKLERKAYFRALQRQGHISEDGSGGKDSNSSDISQSRGERAGGEGDERVRGRGNIPGRGSEGSRKGAGNVGKRERGGGGEEMEKQFVPEIPATRYKDVGGMDSVLQVILAALLCCLFYLFLLPFL